MAQRNKLYQATQAVFVSKAESGGQLTGSYSDHQLFNIFLMQKCQEVQP